MATLRDIKLRIKGIKNTEKITNAMKMVAAAKLRKAQERVTSARPYAHKISSMISHLVSPEDFSSFPLLEIREVKKVIVVVLSADRGLCGAFNTNIIKETHRLINEVLSPNGINTQLLCIGKKGFDYFKKHDIQMLDKMIGVFSSLEFNTTNKVSDILVNGYLQNKFDKIIFVYNEFKSIIQQKVINETLLPISIEAAKIEEGKNEANYIFEPNKKEILKYLLPKHLSAQIWRMLLESNAAELGARMTAMDNATTNAKELIRTLTITYNKERQAAITKEILEIVSGANALREA
ncbi:MAG: ATP synthase F1 subunit gamma [Ignavibacteriales bacterium CG_4_9_14_3_um_filter_30_11]|nr:MAG: ATP synthase F1 subunit gamma [Ignavibacteriales bacterium CG_4_9_14_3_um_filter_30_11]PJC59058.1 MAG: ATP synthase F1 subunit gamma [Ignavibacteria bacterium CG_4_9_14_0_2_um_filter_37_13]